jgi:hypothetical protein
MYPELEAAIFPMEPTVSVGLICEGLRDRTHLNAKLVPPT